MITGTKDTNAIKTITNTLIEEAIRNFLLDFEKGNNINLFFVCETNSRPHAIEVADSDFDLKGFYLPHPSDSLKVIPKNNFQYKIPHLKVIIANQEYDVDVEFLDLRFFALEKVNNNIIYFDYALFSPTVYINKYPNVIDKIKSKLTPSPDEFLFKFKNLHEMCEKQLSKFAQCQNKKMLAALVCGIQYFHVSVYKKFPTYNVWEEIKILKENFTTLIEEKKINKEELSLLEMVFSLIEYYYGEKKTKGRKSSSGNMSEYQSKMLKWLNEKFKTNGKKKKVEKTFDLEFFEEMTNGILGDWLNLSLY